MARGKKQKQEPEPVEELKDAAEEVAAEVVAAAVAAEEPEAAEVAAPAVEEEEDDTKAAASKKRKAEDAPVALSEEEETKRNKTIDAALIAEALASDAADGNMELVLPAKEGVENFTDNDVLSGRGGGTVSA